MFKLDASDSFWYPVTVEIAGDGGKFIKSTFDAQLKRLARSEVVEIMRQIGAGETTDLQVASTILLGWRGICDRDGNEIPFSESARDRLLDVHPVCPAVITAWAESLRGGKAKN